MLVTKKINNNVALAQDAEGNDLVIFGRGVGFPATPYELDDTSAVQRVFRDVNPEIAAAASITDDVLLVASDIADLARKELDAHLNESLAFT